MAEPLISQDMIKRLDQLMLVSRKISRGKMKGERRSRQRGPARSRRTARPGSRMPRPARKANGPSSCQPLLSARRQGLAPDSHRMPQPAPRPEPGMGLAEPGVP